MPPRSRKPAPEPSEHSILLAIARRAHLFLTPEGQPHVTVPISGNTVPLHSPIFRDWLSPTFEQHGFLPSAAQYGAVMRKLEQDAHANPVPSPVHVRTALSAPHTYRIDLQNAAGEAIEVNGKQWTITPNETCRFRRPASSLPLPTPEPNKAPIEKFLMRLFSIKEPQAQMLATWLVSAMLPNLKPPVLFLTGEAAGEAAAILRGIIDPMRCAGNVLPFTAQQFAKMAIINRIPSFSLGTSITKSCKRNLNMLRTGIKVKLIQIGTRRKELTTTIHRPVIIHAQGPIKIHARQLNIAIEKICGTVPAQIFASLLNAVVRGIREMSRQPRLQYFTANSALPAPPENPQLQPPYT